MSTTALAELVGDSDTIGAMTDLEFDDYWKALGTVVRLACRAKPQPQTTETAPARQELSCTSASTERRWSPHQEAPATPFGFRQ
jgi:hypothetical protein